MNDKIDEIKELMSLGKTQEAITVGKHLSSLHDYFSDAHLLIESRYNSFQNEVSRGTLHQEQIELSRNRINSDYLRELSRLKRTISIRFDYSRKELEEKAEVFLMLLRKELEKEEQQQQKYPAFSEDIVSNWVELNEVLSPFQDTFNQDLYNFLNTGENLIIHNLRTYLIHFIDIKLKRDQKLTFDDYDSINRVIYSILKDEVEEKIIDIEERVNQFIAATFDSLGFNFKSIVVMHLEKLRDAFARGELSNSKNFKSDEGLYVVYYEYFNEVLGKEDTTQVRKIVEVLVKRESFKDKVRPIVKQIVEEAKEYKNNLLLEKENQSLRNKIKNQKRPNQRWFLNPFLASLFSTILAIGIYDYFRKEQIVYVEYEIPKELIQRIEGLEANYQDVSTKLNELDIEAKEVDKKTNEIHSLVKQVYQQKTEK